MTTVPAHLRVAPGLGASGDPERAAGMFATLHGLLERRGAPIALLLSGRGHDVRLYVTTDDELLPGVAAAVGGAFPDAHLSPERPLLPTGPVTAAAEWCCPVLPLNPWTNGVPGTVSAASATVAATVAALAATRVGEAAALQVVLRPAAPRRLHRLHRALARARAGYPPAGPVAGRVAAAAGELLAALLSPAPARPDRPRGPAAEAAALADLLARPVFAAVARTCAAAESPGRARALHAGLAAAMLRHGPAAGAWQVRRRRGAAVRGGLARGAPPGRRAGVVGCREAAQLWHPPDPTASPVSLLRAPLRVPPLRPCPPGTVVLAAHHRGGGGAADPVGVSVDELMSHGYVLGPSGTGKTALLGRLVLELAARRTGAVVLDPHGDLVRAVLATLPDEHLPRTRLLDLSDPADVPALNPVWLDDRDRGSPLSAARRSGAVRAVFAEVWGLDPVHAPNLLHFLGAALDVLVAAGGATLVDLPAFLTDGLTRARFLDRAGDPALRREWAMFAAMPRDERARTVRAIYNKAAEFERNPVLAGLLGRPGPGLDLAPTMDGGGLLLVHLPRGLLPDGTVELVGGLLVTELYLAALARESRPPQERPPVVAVIDEFQEFALAGFAKVLTATRKYRLGVVVANQNTSRVAVLGRDLLATLLANAGTLVAFRTGTEDARLLAPAFAPATAADLAAQPVHHCYWRTPRGVTSATALEPVAERRHGTELDAVARSVRLPGRALATRPSAAAAAPADGDGAAW